MINLFKILPIFIDLYKVLGMCWSDIKKTADTQVCIIENKLSHFYKLVCLQVQTNIVPWSAKTLEIPACGEAQNCLFPEASRWSCQPGWDAYSGLVERDAHLGVENINLFYWAGIHNINSKRLLWNDPSPSICFCSCGGAAASMEAVSGSCPCTCTAGWDSNTTTQINFLTI